MRRAWRWIKDWIERNITDEREARDFQSAPQKKDESHPATTSPVFEQQMKDVMEKTEVMPPPPFDAHDRINPEHTRFWVSKGVEKIADAVMHGLAAVAIAVLSWLGFKPAGQTPLLPPDPLTLWLQERGIGPEDVAELIPWVVFVACFLLLHFTRLAKRLRQRWRRG